MGRPVVVPETNVGRFVRHREDAWVLPQVNALGIVEVIATLQRDPQLAKRLEAGAVQFSREHFDWAKNTEGLESFYKSTVARAGRETNAESVAIS